MSEYNYNLVEVDDVLDAGPSDGEDWYRLRVSGAIQSKHLNVSKRQLLAIREILADDA